MKRATHVTEERQHFVVGSVVGNEEAQVGLVEDGSDTNQTGTATRNNGNILPSVLAGLALTMMLVVHVGDSLAQRLDTSGRAIFSRGNGDVDVGRTLETALDVVLDLLGFRNRY